MARAGGGGGGDVPCCEEDEGLKPVARAPIISISKLLSPWTGMHYPLPVCAYSLVSAFRSDSSCRLLGDGMASTSVGVSVEACCAASIFPAPPRDMLQTLRVFPDDISHVLE